MAQREVSSHHTLKEGKGNWAPMVPHRLPDDGLAGTVTRRRGGQHIQQTLRFVTAEWGVAGARQERQIARGIYSRTPAEPADIAASRRAKRHSSYRPLPWMARMAWMALNLARDMRETTSVRGSAPPPSRVSRVGREWVERVAPGRMEITMELLEAMNVIEDQDWLEAPSETIAGAVSKVLTRPTGGPTKLDDFLNGVWFGHPLHPMLTDIPIGAWTVTLALDGLEAVTGRPDFTAGADAALGAGLLGAVGAAITGAAQWQYTVGRQRRLGLSHALLNVAAVGLYSASLLCRLNGKRGAGRVTALIGYGVVAVSGYIGGDLAFGQRLGVTHIPEQEVPETWQSALADDELHEGDLKRVTIAGMPVLVVRQQGHLYALAETCAHLGGPLSEGTLGDCSVTCPWHGSRFRLTDGAILNGPTTFPQPVYETRVRDGMIEVRPARSRPQS